MWIPDDVVATGLRVFPYGLRVLNFLAVSDSPIHVDKDHWMAILRQYQIDGRLVFDPNHAETGAVLASYLKLGDSVTQPPIEVWRVPRRSTPGWGSG